MTFVPPVDFTKVQYKKHIKKYGNNISNIGVFRQQLTTEQSFYVVAFYYHDERIEVAVFVTLDKQAAIDHAKRLSDTTGLELCIAPEDYP